MAKNNQAETRNSYERPAFDDAFLATCYPHSPMEVRDILKTLWTEGDFPNAWDHEFTATICPLLIGDPGVGKSVIIRTVAEELAMEYRRIPMGEQPEGDTAGVADPFNVNEHGQYRMRMPDFMPTVPPNGKNKRGVAHFDEVATGGPMHQDTLSILLTDGYRSGISHHPIAKGWHFCASMNPESARHVSQQQLDDKVRARMQPIYMKPNPGQVVYFLGNMKRCPDFLYGFFIMHKENIFTNVAPRAWETVAAYAHRWKAAGVMDRSHFLHLVSPMLTKNMADLLTTYLTLGDDPDVYPISAKSIMSADPDVHKTHQKRMERWVKEGNDALIGATGFDISLHLSDSQLKLENLHIERMCDIIRLINRSDLVHSVVNSCKAQTTARHLINYLGKDKKFCTTLADLQDRYDANQRKERI